MRIKLDDIDIELLIELLDDTTRPLNSLSKILGVPKSTIHAKMKRLEKYGIIEKYSIKINREVLNFQILAYIFINFDQSKTREDQEQVALEIAKDPRVDECHLLAGDKDILIKLWARNINELGEYSTKTLKAIKGVGRSITYIVMNQIKKSNTSPYLVESLIPPLFIEKKEEQNKYE